MLLNAKKEEVIEKASEAETKAEVGVEVGFPATLPPIHETKLATLQSMDITAKVFAEVEKFRGMTLSSLEDKDGYKVISANRKFVKEMRVQATKACEAGREDFVRGQKEWVALEKELKAWFLAIEEPLEKQEKAYEAELKRKKDEEQRLLALRTEARMKLLRDVDAAFDMVACQTLSDEQWAEYYTPKVEANNLRILGNLRSKQLREADVEMLPHDAAEMDSVKFELFLHESREAKQIRKDKDAADALAESDRLVAEKAKTERYMTRFNSLAKLGKAVSDVGLDLEKLREMEDPEFQQIYMDVVEAKKKADNEALLDARFQRRYVELVALGVAFNTDIGRDVRDMEPFEYESFATKAKTEWNAAQKKILDDANELARLRAEQVVPPPVIRPAYAPTAKLFSAPIPEPAPIFPDHIAPMEMVEEQKVVDVEPIGESGDILTDSVEPVSQVESVLTWALDMMARVELAPQLDDPDNSAILANLCINLRDTLNDIIEMFPEVA